MKKSTLFKQSALALTIALSLTAHAQPYSQVIIFGDSLSDTGNLAKQMNDKDLVKLLVGEAQPSFTTNPDTTWAGVLASSYGHTAKPNDNKTLTGTNYAVGGARAETEVVQPLNIAIIPSVRQQMDGYFEKHGKADPNALYAVWIGANDLLEAGDAKYSTFESIGILQDAAKSEISSVNRLHEAGAKHILVPNLPDVGLTPRMINNPTHRVSATGAAQYYNSVLYTGLNQSSANVIPANTFALLREATTNKEAFGFKTTDDYGCRPHALLPSLTSLACGQSAWKSPTANEDYAFADDIHPSGRTHRILAQYYRSIIDAPAQVGKLPQQMLNTATISNEHLSRRLNRLDGQAHSIWADVHANSSGPLSTIGLDIAGKRSHTGAYVSHQNQDYTLSDTLNADAQNIGFGVYHRHAFNNFYLSANAGVDRLAVDTHRQIAWEGEARSHNADATARRFHAGLQAGYGVSLDKATIRPYVGVNSQKLKVDALTEDNPALSTAMRFGKQELDSLQGKVGIDVDYAITPKLTLTGGVSHAHEFKENDRAVNAALTSVREYTKGFDTAVIGDKVHATSANLGVQGQLGRTQVGVGAYATQLDSKHDTDTDIGGYIRAAWAF